MVVNTYFDVCAIFIMFMLILALFARKVVKGRSNQLFLLMCFSIFITAILDCLDEWVAQRVVDPKWCCFARSAIDYAYYLIRNITGPIYILYICSILGIWYVFRLKSNRRLKLVCIPYIIDVIVIVSNHWTKLLFYFDENMNYVRGPLMPILYVIAFYYICFGVYILFQYKNLLDRMKWWIIVIFLPMNGVFVCIQMFIPNLRVEILSTALFALIISVGVQRPEELRDYVVDAQSYNSFVQEMKKAYSAKRPMCLLLLKCVNSKTIRDNVGLDVYSLLLRKISQKMAQISRVMNLRGEIFYIDKCTYVVVASETRRDSLIDFGRLLSAYMREPFRLRQLEVQLDARSCIVSIPTEIASYDALLNFVGTFHTRIPNEDRLLIMSELMESKDFRIRNDMDAIINRGIAKQNFKMYYQPIFSIRENKFVSAEALIRLEDEEYGFVSPGLFIPVAEENGAIHQIGEFVLEDVCRFIAESDFDEIGLKYVEVNLSVSQCIEPDLAERITGYLKMYGVKPQQVNLEITETGVDYDPATTDRNIRILSESGLTFSLDDYGTGYSNIKRVVSLPLNIVKLDKSLVDEMDNPMMWTVITNTVRMLKRMKKHILVEGVEDERSFKRFAELGCDYIQGYYFAKPMPENIFIDFVKRHNQE